LFTRPSEYEWSYNSSARTAAGCATYFAPCLYLAAFNLHRCGGFSMLKLTQALSLSLSFSSSFYFPFHQRRPNLSDLLPADSLNFTVFFRLQARTFDKT
jgi:hypothetical protein